MKIHHLLEGWVTDADTNDANGEYDHAENKDSVEGADIHGNVYNDLVKKGYKFLGAGVEQAAFLEPGTGLVLKIFGNDYGYNEMSHGQENFKKWADFCMQPENKSNPFLPGYYGWTKFKYKKVTYLQIRCERLFPANPGWSAKGIYFGNLLAHDMKSAQNKPYPSDMYKGQKSLSQLILLVGGEEQFKLLWNTIYKVAQYGRKNGLYLDLHDENFMLGSNGMPVINDPFYGGDSDDGSSYYR